MKMMPIVGLMSGTSIDGIDASFVYTNGDKLTRTNCNSVTPYKNNTKKLIEDYLSQPEKSLKNIYLTQSLSNQIALEHANATKKLLNKFNLSPVLVGFHGQTIFHNPKKRISIQLGNGKLLAQLLKINVVEQFRINDLKHGGQGAPLAPIYHKSILETLNFKLPSIIINIGGISNLSYWDGLRLFGFDTGPGNNLIDYQMQNIFSLLYDKDGNFAKSGIINYNLAKNYCDNDYYNKLPPKSLERQDLFDNKTLKHIEKLNPNDRLATLTYITALSICLSIKMLPKQPYVAVIVGGGQKNKFLIKLIKELVNCKIITANELKLPGDYIESELIAFLTARRYFNLVSTYPSTTGVSKDIICGELSEYD